MKATVNELKDTKNPDYKMCMFEDTIVENNGNLTITSFEPTLVNKAIGEAIAKALTAKKIVMISAKERA